MNWAEPFQVPGAESESWCSAPADCGYVLPRTAERDAKLAQVTAQSLPSHQVACCMTVLQRVWLRVCTMSKHNHTATIVIQSNRSLQHYNSMVSSGSIFELVT